jgi:cell division protein FtsB
MKDKTIILIWAIFITLAFAAMNMEYVKLEKENAELKHEIIKLESVVDYLENASNSVR